MNRHFFSLIIITALFTVIFISCDKDDEPTSATTQYSFTVYACNAAWSPDNPVPYNTVADAIVSLRDESGHERSYTTDNDGKLTLTLVEGNYFYQVTKGNASNISKDGFLIAGIFTSQEEISTWAQQPSAVIGGLKFTDINNDQRINNDDKLVDRYFSVNQYFWYHPSLNVYIASADFAPTYDP